MIICDNCPCLNKGATLSDYINRDGDRVDYFDEWWYCGVDERDIGRPGQLRKDIRVKNCPLKQIELKDGTIFRPEEVDDKN